MGSNRGRLDMMLVALLAIAGCSGGPASPSGQDVTVTITATGVTPPEVRVGVGGRVSFVNNGARVHGIASDPVQTHTDCPQINEVGNLGVGQTRRTASFSAARTCGFHDHLDEFNPAFKGRIVVQ